MNLTIVEMQTPATPAIAAGKGKGMRIADVPMVSRWSLRRLVVGREQFVTHEQFASIEAARAWAEERIGGALEFSVRRYQ